MTPQQQRNLVIGVLVVLVLVAIAAVYYHEQWMRKNCTCAGKGHGSGFHGWRHQHYEDNPYNGQRYHCGLGAKGASRPAAEGFTGDLDHWPTSGTFGNLADTNPYGSYAGHVDMHYPTYNEGYVQDMYWTRT